MSEAAFRSQDRKHQGCNSWFSHHIRSVSALNNVTNHCVNYSQTSWRAAFCVFVQISIKTPAECLLCRFSPSAFCFPVPPSLGDSPAWAAFHAGSQIEMSAAAFTTAGSVLNPKYWRLQSTPISTDASARAKWSWGCFKWSFLSSAPHSVPRINIQPINWADNSVESEGDRHLLKAEHKNLRAPFQCQIYFLYQPSNQLTFQNHHLTNSTVIWMNPESETDQIRSFRLMFEQHLLL